MRAGNDDALCVAIQFIRCRIIKSQKGWILKNPGARRRFFEGNLKKSAAGLVQAAQFPMLHP
jgi:hypothetical protein